MKAALWFAWTHLIPSGETVVCLVSLGLLAWGFAQVWQPLGAIVLGGLLLSGLVWTRTKGRN